MYVLLKFFTVQFPILPIMGGMRQKKQSNWFIKKLYDDWVYKFLFELIIDNKIKMSHLQKIEKQVHIASVFVCANDIQNSYKSASWFRRNQRSKTLVKKQLFQGQAQSVYVCSLFDFGSSIELELETAAGTIKQYQYGPIKLDKKTQTILENELSKTQSFPVSVLLNKSQKYEGQVSFSKIQSESLILVLRLESKLIEIEINKPRKWNQCSQMFSFKSQTPEEVGISLGHNKLQFVKSLSKLNIYCHYGNFLHLTFKSEGEKIMFLLHLLAIIQFKTILKSEKSSNQRRYSLRFSQISNLFASADCFTDSMTPYGLTQNIMDDFRNIIFTPKPELDREIRERGFVSFQKFIGLQESSHRQSQKLIQAMKTDETIKAIKQQSIQQQNESRNKSSKLHAKSHEFIFAWNKNKQNRLKNTSKQRADIIKLLRSRSNYSKNISKQAYYQKLTYEQLLERNKFLEQQSQKLAQQNKQLRRKVRELQFVSKSKSKSKSRDKDRPVPQFIKEQIFQKNMERTEDSNRSARKQKRHSSISKYSKDLYKLTKTFGLRDSTPDSRCHYHFVQYLKPPQP